LVSEGSCRQTEGENGSGQGEVYEKERSNDKERDEEWKLIKNEWRKLGKEGDERRTRECET